MLCKGHHSDKRVFGRYRPCHICADKPRSEHPRASSRFLAVSHARRVAWHRSQILQPYRTFTLSVYIMHCRSCVKLYRVRKKMIYLFFFHIFLAVFYSASALLAMQSAVLARGILSVCRSVLPSRSGIVSRRMKIRSCGFQHLIGQSL